MSVIKRYDEAYDECLGGGHCCYMEADDTGEWVSYDDHKVEVEKLQSKFDDLVKLIKSPKVFGHWRILNIEELLEILERD